MRRKTVTQPLSLFTEPRAVSETETPLALRMTPKRLEDIIGQEHLLGEGKTLRRALESDRLSSAIFFGPPGCGKSAVVRLVASLTRASVEELNAVTAGVADVRAVIDRAKERRGLSSQRTLLILDEIHRFNRAQQDALLPDVERGIVILIGLTTENPFFYVNSALLSRAQAFEFKPLSDEALKAIAERALHDRKEGLGWRPIDLDSAARDHAVRQANGDARRLLNALELAAMSTPPGPDGRVHITLSVMEECVQRRALVHDRSGDQHYDIASAFIKSLRGGDPDAALYWMARLLRAGDDPRFIARRLIISAAEDVGNADPRALLVAHAALAAVEFVGLPEGRIPLAQAAVYITCAPKSNASYLALEKAEAEVEKGALRGVPRHLKDSNLDRQALGHGQGYLYPHSYPGHFVPQEYWPDPVTLYTPGDLGYEVEMRKRLDSWKSQAKAGSGKNSSTKETN